MTFTLSITKEFEWTLTLHDHILDRHNCGVLDGTPQTLDSVGMVCQLLRTLNSSKVCRGYDDKKFQDVMDHQSKTLHSDASTSAVYQDSSSLAVPTIRHRDCQYLIPCDSSMDRCRTCCHYWLLSTFRAGDFRSPRRRWQRELLHLVTSTTGSCPPRSLSASSNRHTTSYD